MKKIILFLGILFLSSPAWAASTRKITTKNSSVENYLTVSGTATVVGNAFSVGGSTFVVTNGKVGIGTTMPAEKLEVLNGNIKTNYGVIASSSVIANGVFTGTVTVHGTGFNVGGTTGFTVLGSSVGINTTTPATVIDVSSYNFSSALRFTNSAPGDASTVAMGQVEFWSAEIDGGPAVRAKIVGAGSENIWMGGTLQFWTKFQSAPIAQRMVIMDTGKVGIGSTAPTEKLDVLNGNIKTNYGVAASTLTVTSTATFSLNISSNVTPTVNALYANTIPKVVGFFDNLETIDVNSVGISSITTIATDVFRINFQVPFATNTFAAIVTGESYDGNAVNCAVLHTTKSTSSVDVKCSYLGSYFGVNAIVLGRQ
jgi:hypothetical protein